ncbi:methyltransferase domain-containing protein [Pelagibius sp. CAU 1746]|uniref:class I SAM-dependent methyltransferase n=1 Tax=Pelagibius sp. CAU 1746 TaxID=3140370 RepID=UPI00325AB26B
MLSFVFRKLATLRKSLRRLRDSRLHRRYIQGDRKPWTPGYHVEKRKVIAESTSNPDWPCYAIPENYGFRLDERVVEYPWFVARLPGGGGRLLDAGSVLNFDYLVENPKISEKNLYISTLAPESHAFWKKGVNYVFEDLRESCFRDSYFDWICCLSTLEHIGLDNTRFSPSDATKLENRPESCLKAVGEFRRMLKPGGRLYLSVPYGKAKNHRWFQVFDGDMIDRVIAEFQPNEVVETVYRYSPDGWTVSDRLAAADETYFDIHTQSEYDSDFAAASRAVICLEMVK